MKFDSDSAKINGMKSSRKGVRNSVNKEIKEKFKLLIEDNLERLQKDINSMKSVERFNSLMQLAKYVLPTLKSVEVEANVKNNEVNSELIEKLLKIDDSHFDKIDDNEE